MIARSSRAAAEPLVRALVIAAAALASSAAGSAAAAQSLLSAGGLGIPVGPVDARARALGNPGIGLIGGALLASDPAAAADLPIPSATFTSRASWVDVQQQDGSSADVSGTRFPLVGVSYPVGRVGVASLLATGMLDQRWAVERSQDLALGDDSLAVNDRFVSDGGVSALQLGFAQRLSRSLSVGISAGAYTGQLTRSFTRSFDSTSVDTPLEPFETQGRWRFSGATATLGAIGDLAGVGRLAVSVTFSGSLDADPVDETAGAAASFDLPTEYRVGMSGLLAPSVTATLALTHADWSGAASGMGEDAAGSATSWGAGLELGRNTLFGREAPLRVGYRSATLPFRFGGDEATESAWSGGLGLALAGAGPLALARGDLALERGRRSAGALSEDFWRLSASLRLSGF